ncbi:hypothetical protein [Microcoleus sp. herbarium14]|uniref:hypothetical protein n=1 Tax=Microcoleus sp. herbarium14 TaxID=3055439 RepID=UPI002FD165AE
MLSLTPWSEVWTNYLVLGSFVHTFRSGFEQLVLEWGTMMQPKPLPKTIKRGQPRICYANCQRLVLKNRSLTYVEGYAMAQGVSLPLHHAWLLDTDGCAIDPT